MAYFTRGSKAALLAAGLAAGALAAVGAAQARAADPSAAAPVVQGVIDCRKIDDTAQRLACYDSAVAKMADAESKGDLVTLDREQRRAARRQAFGFSLPSFGFLNRGEKPEDVDRVTLAVDSAWQIAGGKWVVKMVDGAVWRQIDSNDLLRAPRSGSTAVVRKGVLGSFFMNVDGQIAIRVHRDN